MKTVMVIEDNEAIRTELLSVLELEGYATIGAENGEVGLTLAQQHQPGLIFSDIAMPVLDGFAMIAQLRQNPQTAHIPVVFLTGETEPSIIQEGTVLGSVGFLAKPCTIKDLVAAVNKHLGS